MPASYQSLKRKVHRQFGKYNLAQYTFTTETTQFLLNSLLVARKIVHFYTFKPAIKDMYFTVRCFILVKHVLYQLI